MRAGASGWKPAGGVWGLSRWGLSRGEGSAPGGLAAGGSGAQGAGARGPARRRAGAPEPSGSGAATAVLSKLSIG